MEDPEPDIPPHPLWSVIIVGLALISWVVAIRLFCGTWNIAELILEHLGRFF